MVRREGGGLTRPEDADDLTRRGHELHCELANCRHPSHYDGIAGDPIEGWCQVPVRGRRGTRGARSRHSRGSITERYSHAAQVLFPGAASRGEERMFGGSGGKSGSN